MVIRSRSCCHTVNSKNTNRVFILKLVKNKTSLSSPFIVCVTASKYRSQKVGQNWPTTQQKLSRPVQEGIEEEAKIYAYYELHLENVRIYKFQLHFLTMGLFFF